MRQITESYAAIGCPHDVFDIEFWQVQGDEAIFRAALEMALDYLMIRYGHADEPRFQRTVESFEKA